MINKRIVYTRHEDGGVSVCTPTQWQLAAFASGGVWGRRPRGWYEAQVERQIADGIEADTARRWVRAMIDGGLTTAEAFGLIRDRDCARFGYHHEIHDELPADRWFRNAWSRSTNGGPIVIDVEKARPIQWERARSAAQAFNRKRQESFELHAPLEVPWGKIREAIINARDEDELRAVWPEGVAR